MIFCSCYSKYVEVFFFVFSFKRHGSRTDNLLWLTVFMHPCYFISAFTGELPKAFCSQAVRASVSAWLYAKAYEHDVLQTARVNFTKFTIYVQFWDKDEIIRFWGEKSKVKPKRSKITCWKCTFSPKTLLVDNSPYEKKAPPNVGMGPSNG